VLAIDPIHRLLRAVGKRLLRGEVIEDASRLPRVIFRTPNWGDFVHVACNEIRSCGSASDQIARRLQALLDNLVASLPRVRHAALEEERLRLDRALVSLYPKPDDLALARIADFQGLGGQTRIDRSVGG
jgi:uncharacterized membrane protein